MKKLNQFITEYIVKKKLDQAINSEIDVNSISSLEDVIKAIA